MAQQCTFEYSDGKRENLTVHFADDMDRTAQQAALKFLQGDPSKIPGSTLNAAAQIQIKKGGFLIGGSVYIFVKRTYPHTIEIAKENKW